MDHDKEKISAPVFTKILTDIEETGWTAIGVFDPEGKEPTFTYTIGLGLSYNHPEIIAIGLPPQTAHGVIAGAIDKIKDGESFANSPDKDVLGLLANDFHCRFLPLSDAKAQEFMFQAYNFYESIEEPSLISTIQLVWPDEKDLYPWDKDCNLDIAAAQHVLAPAK